MKRKVPTNRMLRSHNEHLQGQALVEYVLILVLGVIGLIAILVILAPAVGNVFSNTVYNLLGQTTTPQEPLDPTEFWDIVTAVASYTPESPDLQTNTPLPATPLPTATNTAGPSPTPSNTSTPSDTPTPTTTATFGPSPTPPDTEYTYPFADDGSDPDTFHVDIADEFWMSGPWTAEYWDINWTNSSGNGCNWGNFFNSSNGNIANPPIATISVPRIKFPDASYPDDYWQTDNDKAHPSLPSDNFCARYSGTVALEATTYTINYQKDDGVRIYVSPNGSTWTKLLDRWSYNYQEDIAGASFDYTPPSAGTYYFRIVFRDTGGAGRLTVTMNKSTENTTPACNWELDSGTGNTSPPSWHDSVGRYYFRNQECVMRLRGTVDLTGAVEPYLEFYDRYDINSFDKALVAIAIEGTDDWKFLTVHDGPVTNWTFTRQRIDLARFADDLGGLTDFRGNRIELRFIMRSDNSNERDGWWIDDISIREIPETPYYLGFQDPVDTADHWIPEGTWTVSNARARSGTAWDDSPGSNYQNNTNTSIRLNGRLDLSSSSPVPVTAPEVVFWQYVDLDPVDRIYVEISTDKINWSPLETRSIFGYQPPGPMATGDIAVESWTQAVATIPASYIGQSRVYIRFRLETDGSNTDQGWVIDDIEFRNKPTVTAGVGDCDTFDGGTANWVLNGNWGLTSSIVRDGAFALTDSPSGYYARNSNYTAEFVPYLEIDSMTRPVVTFYHQWDIREGDDSDDELVVEISPDDGFSWTKVFSFIDNDNNFAGQNKLDPYPYWDVSIPQYDERLDEVQSWMREVIDLTPYIGTTAPGVPGLKIRFRLFANGSVEEDGWYIDTFCFLDMPEPLITLPFADDMEAGTFNWYTSGKWQITSSTAHSGTYSWEDTPGNMQVDETGIIELRPTVNLTGAIDPALYYWTKYNISRNRLHWEVEIALADAAGRLLSDWTAVPSTQLENVRNDGWHRMEVDLRPYIGQNIRVRWQAQSLNNRGRDGAYLDDVQIISRTEEATYIPPYNEDIEALNPGEFVLEHEWDVVTEYRSFGSGPSLGPGQWDVEWYDNGRGCSGSAYIDFGSQVGTSTLDEINFTWSDGTPSSNGITVDNRWGAVFIRNFYIPAATTYQFSGLSDDGVRVWVYPTGTLPDLSNPTYEHRWFNCGVSESFTSPPINFPAGNVTVMVHFIHNYGSSDFIFNIEGESKMFTDSPSGNYDRRTESVVELEGLVNIPASSNYTLYWDQRYDLGNNHRINLDVSTDGGFTWTTIYQRTSGTDLNWETMTADLTPYAGNLVTFRFRLDALTSDGPREGWWIDNIRIIE